MPLDRRFDKYESDRRQADVSVRANLDFILQNLTHLRKVDRNGRMENAARSFKAMLDNGEELTPGQRSYTEGIYEKVWRGAGYDSVNVHADKKRRGLKFG